MVLGRVKLFFGAGRRLADAAGECVGDVLLYPRELGVSCYSLCDGRETQTCQVARVHCRSGAGAKKRRRAKSPEFFARAWFSA